MVRGSGASYAVPTRTPRSRRDLDIHPDGRGTVLATCAARLDPRRNPGWTTGQVEAGLGRPIGGRRMIRLPRGLTRDGGIHCLTQQRPVLPPSGTDATVGDRP